jgi:hypothetical protein
MSMTFDRDALFEKEEIRTNMNQLNLPLYVS